MIKPKCKICKGRHWPSDAHISIAGPVLATPLATMLATTIPLLATKHGRYADVAKRRRYMRQYMAKRRIK